MISNQPEIRVSHIQKPEMASKNKSIIFGAFLNAILLVIFSFGLPALTGINIFIVFPIFIATVFIDSFLMNYLVYKRINSSNRSTKFKLIGVIILFFVFVVIEILSYILVNSSFPTLFATLPFALILYLLVCAVFTVSNPDKNEVSTEEQNLDGKNFLVALKKVLKGLLKVLPVILILLLPLVLVALYVSFIAANWR